MSLAKDYCKELLSQLDQLAVYMPGRAVNVGDVITYGHIGVFSRPLGDFQVVTTLEELNVKVLKRKDQNSDSYRYASTGGTSASFQADVDAGNMGKGTLNIGFSKAGSLYVAALECKREEMTNLHTLDDQLIPHRQDVDWNNCYIITSVTRAKRAIVMQSSSTSAELVINGQTRDLNPTSGSDVQVNAEFSVKSYRDASFIKDWSNEASLFMTLVRYKRNVLGEWNTTTHSFRTPQTQPATPNGAFTIVSVNKEEILEEEALLS